MLIRIREVWHQELWDAVRRNQARLQTQLCACQTTSPNRKSTTSQRKQQVGLGRACICVALHAQCWISHQCTQDACAEHLAVANVREVYKDRRQNVC